MTDLGTDLIGEAQELDFSKNVEGYFFTNTKNGVRPEFVLDGPPKGNKIETRISIKVDSVSHIKMDSNRKSIDTKSAVARREGLFKRTELKEFKGVVKNN